MSRQMAGIQAWILQRISAVYLGLFCPVALVYLLLQPPTGYTEWLSRVSNPWVYSSILLFVLALLIHAWVGVRNVLIDYVKPFGLRLTLLLLVSVALVLSGIWITAILPTPTFIF